MNRAGTRRASSGAAREWSVVVAGLVALAIAAPGCRRRRAPDEPEATLPAPPAARLVDRTLPGELAEGTEVAFGLKLPRGMRVGSRFNDLILAKADLPADQVANYIRQRVVAEGVVTGPSKTVFSKAAIKATPGRVFGIEVASSGGYTELQIRDVTAPPVPAGVSTTELWRRSGFNPDGTPLDPDHME